MKVYFKFRYALWKITHRTVIFFALFYLFLFVHLSDVSCWVYEAPHLHSTAGGEQYVVASRHPEQSLVMIGLQFLIFSCFDDIFSHVSPFNAPAETLSKYGKDDAVKCFLCYYGLRHLHSIVWIVLATQTQFFRCFRTLNWQKQKHRWFCLVFLEKSQPR